MSLRRVAAAVSAVATCCVFWAQGDPPMTLAAMLAGAALTLTLTPDRRS